jgi:hypothetical protein
MPSVQSIRSVRREMQTMWEGGSITNTYPKGATMDEKTLEELRCVRCVLERILRVMDEGLFVDYQMEKFGNRMPSKSLRSSAAHIGEGKSLDK